MTTPTELRALLAECSVILVRLTDGFERQGFTDSDSHKLLSRITAALSEKDEGGWIKVGERLPELSAEEVAYLAVTGHRGAVPASQIVYAFQAAKHDGDECYYAAWQPLPPLPERE